MIRAFSFAALALCACGVTAGFAAPELSRYKLDLGSEVRVFPERARDARQTDASGSISVLGRADYAWKGDSFKLSIEPFVRFDSADGRRTHADLRELELRFRSGNFDWRAGIGKVFWGTAESVHLVDVVNQTDGVESIDGEDKLGQPLISVSWSTAAGVFSGFVLPVFRERTLSAVDGRMRAPVPFYHGEALYESDRRRRHVDTAFRWNYSAHGIDLGVSRFDGTSREPRFDVIAAGAEPQLQPIYDQIHQTTIDVNAVIGSWIFKSELLHQNNRIKNFSAAVAGFEYTLANNATDAPEIAVLSEYAWDSRGRNSPSPTQRDVFFGIRVSMNDVAGGEMLAGILQDVQGGGRFVSVDASRRIGDAGTLSLKLRVIDGHRNFDALSAVTRDDHVILEYTLHL